MTRIRKLGAVALAAPLAMGFPVLAVTVPAHAAATTSVISPSAGAVFTHGSQITARAHFDLAVTMELRVKGPGIGDQFLTKGNVSGNLSAPIDIGLNGRYTVYLKGRPTGVVYDSNTFTVRVPPATPGGVSASVTGNKLNVEWNLGTESDLSGYTVNASDGLGSRSGSDGKFCSGTSCSTSFTIPQGKNGSVSVSVRAQRPNGSGGSVSSGSASASTSLGNGGGGGGGGNGGNNAPDLPPNTNPPSNNTPLTPYNRDSPYALPSVQPDGATPGFTYPAPSPVVDNHLSPKAKNMAATSSLQWGKSVAIALVLLIAAAHLGTWTRRLRTAQAGISGRGMAARAIRGGTGRARVRNAQRHIALAEASAKSSAAAKPATRGKAAKPGTKSTRRPAGRRSAKPQPTTKSTAPSAKPGAKKSQPSPTSSNTPVGSTSQAAPAPKSPAPKPPAPKTPVSEGVTFPSPAASQPRMTDATTPSDGPENVKPTAPTDEPKNKPRRSRRHRRDK